MIVIPLIPLVLGLSLPFAPGGDTPASPVEVRVPLSAEGELDVAELVERLSGLTGAGVPRPGSVNLPARGLAGALTLTLLGETLGEGAAVDVREGSLVVTVPRERLDPARRADWTARVRALADRAAREARRRSGFGMRARESYRPGDPGRPTVCLVHGLNSNSGSFVHMVPLLEEAGFGVVVYDFPDNRDLDVTAPEFARDWAAFRRRAGERRPWAIVAHSMGGLIARHYVEGPGFAGDVTDLILIGPPNRGASVAKLQSVLQLVEGARAVKSRHAGALAILGDGLGESADDMLPESPFLKALNARPRRDGVRYHILAGSSGFVSAAARRDIESRLGLATRAGGPLGRLARLAAGDLPSQLDEICEGTGDGCVSVASTRLEGVRDHVVIPANHVELIRGPALYPDPGPVACMPLVLDWLETARTGATGRGTSDGR